MSLMQLIEAVANEQQNARKKDSPRLGDLIESYNKAEQFKPGDVVVWKEGMQSQNIPRYDEEAIVMEVLDAPVFNDKAQVGSPSYQAPYDLRLAALMSDGTLVFALFDSRRFTLKRRFEE